MPNQCRATWYRPSRDHVCRCTRPIALPISRPHKSRHQCSCGGWVPQPIPQDIPACDHPQWRFATISHASFCEQCERRRQGWGQCRVDDCPNQRPPDSDTCGGHSEGSVVSIKCSACGGQGDAPCPDYDCHGDYCDSGWVECEACLGKGTSFTEIKLLYPIDKPPVPWGPQLPLTEVA